MPTRATSPGTQLQSFVAQHFRPLLALLFTAFVFYIANRGALHGYFSDDDLDTLSWSHVLDWPDVVEGVVTPILSSGNFRPMGALFYHFADSIEGLNFSTYVYGIQLIHLLNVLLVWLLGRRLGLSDWTAFGGALFFTFHRAVFGIYWRPMYVFDLLCASFCLASLLLYTHKRYIWSVVCFWLAFKSKEIAIGLPLALLAYEWLLGEKKWKPLLPFFAISSVFGVQAILNNSRKNDDYTLRLTVDALWTCVSFYARKLAPIPLALLLVATIKDRRVRFGLSMFLVLLAPMLILPGRLFGPYLYAPMIGLAISFGAAWQAIPTRISRFAMPLFLALWLPWTYLQLKEYRKAVIAEGDENRAYVIPVVNFQRANPFIATFLYDGAPETLRPHGVVGLFKYFHPVSVIAAGVEDAPALQALQNKTLAIVVWDANSHTVSFISRRLKTPDLSYIKLGPLTPVWQLGDGWYFRASIFRWIRPHATARLLRPAGAGVFEVTLNISPDYIHAVKQSEFEARLNGDLIGKLTISEAGWKTVRWNLPVAPAGTVQIDFKVTPPMKTADGNEFGVPIGSFGFPAN